MEKLQCSRFGDSPMIFSHLPKSSDSEQTKSTELPFNNLKKTSSNSSVLELTVLVMTVTTHILANVVTFQGICLEPLSIIWEYMQKTDLWSYLQTHRVVTSHQKLKWASSIAAGVGNFSENYLLKECVIYIRKELSTGI